MSDNENPQPAPNKLRRVGRLSVLDPVLVASALTETNGNISAVARRFNVQRASVQEFISKRETLKKVLEDSRETRIDNAESALDRAVEQGEGWAVCFTLKTQGRKRGYSERHEVTGPDGLPINPVIVTMILSREQELGLIGEPCVVTNTIPAEIEANETES